MGKKGFSTFTKNAERYLKTKLDEEATKVWNDAMLKANQIREEVRAYLKKHHTNLIGDSPQISVYVTRSSKVPITVNITASVCFDISEEDLPESIEELKKEYETLINKYHELKGLERKVPLLISAWKMKAEENKTYFDEPFPAELYDFLPEEIKKMLRREEK